MTGLRAVVLLCIFFGAYGQEDPRVAWSKPFPPHRVIGNVYFVGTVNLGSYLITTPEGHILINTDFEQTVPTIRAGVEKLGFRFNDIRIILGSHAHGDHMEADAMVREMTGARVMAMAEDVPALKAITPEGKPHPIDRVLHDGDEVKLGGTVLTAHLTAGHTKGCTTWSMKATESGKSYDVVIVCSVGWNPGYVLYRNPEYPRIADDYIRSFATLRKLPCDIFLAAHGSFYNLDSKYARLQQGAPNPFIDRAGYLAYIDLKEKQFQDEFNRQKNGGPKP
jgi:metallo-beta-lactamase class B